MRNKTMAVTAINILASYVKWDKPKTMQEKKKTYDLKIVPQCTCSDFKLINCFIKYNTDEKFKYRCNSREKMMKNDKETAVHCHDYKEH